MRVFEKFLEKKLEYSAYILVSGLILFYGFYSGLNVSRMTVDVLFVVVNIVVVDAVSSSLFFTFFLVVTGGLLLLELYSRRSIPVEDDAGSVVAVVPVFRDGGVLANSVESLNDSNYEDLRVVVVCEPGDDGCIEVAEGLDCEVLLNDYPGSKAGAINTAFERFEDAEFFAIFDADEIVDPCFVSRAVGSIEIGYDAFQGRRIPIPSGLVESFAYCERVLFHSAYKLSELSGFRNLRSSSTVMRRGVWERVEGYEDLLTEDLDFPHKCFRSGVSVRQDRRVTNLMEAPHSWSDFWYQRKRWRMGQVQVLHKALRGGYRNNLSYSGVVSLGRLVFSVIVGFLILTMIPKFVVLFLLDLELVLLVPLLVSVVLVCLVSLKDYWSGKTGFVGFGALLAPLVFVVTGFLAVKSLLEYVFSWEGEWYRVEKSGEE